MAAAAKKAKASSDEVGLAMLEELLRAGGKKRMAELDAPPEEEQPEEEAKSDELDLDELEALIKSKE